MTDRSSADVIVIGAGHNGLVAACYLARAGLAVEVLEAAPAAGGMSSTSALVPEAPNHLINPCAVDMILLRASPVVRDLELHKHGFHDIEVDPPFVHLAPDGASLAMFRDPRRTAEDIRRFSTKDAATFLELARTMDAGIAAGLPIMGVNPTRPGLATLAQAASKGGRHPVELARLAALLRKPLADVLMERFESPMVRSPMAVLTGIGPITDRASAAYLLVFGLVHRLGVSRVVGGTQRLVDALLASLEASGGRVRTSAAVEEILVQGGSVTGVRLASGEVLSAPTVVGACDPRTTLGRLLADGVLPTRTAKRVDAIPTTNSNLASLKIDVAVSGRLEPRRHQALRHDRLDLRIPTAFIGSLDDVLHSHQRAVEGALPERYPFYGVIPTAADPSQAPAGQDTFYLWQGWVPGEPADLWDNAQQYTKAVFSEAASYYDGLEELEIGRFVETWPMLRDRTLAPEGNLFHADIRPTRMGPLRPAVGLAGYRTPVSGLFLSGNGTHPGSGVSGLPGRLAAAAVLRSRAGRRGDPAAQCPDQVRTSPAPPPHTDHSGSLHR